MSSLQNAMLRQLTNLTVQVNFLQHPNDPIAALEGALASLDSMLEQGGLDPEARLETLDFLHVQLRELRDAQPASPQ